LNILNKPTAVYVHELVSVLKFPNPRKHIEPLVNNRFLYLYPSKAVKLFLESALHLNASKMLQLDYYIPDTDISLFEQPIDNTQLENTNKTIRVCGMGVASQRKGTDIFIMAASVATRKKPNIKFQWIGGFETYEQEQSYKKMVMELKLDAVFRFTGQLPPEKAQQELSSNDVLFLSSREDPYPLVVIEAAKFSIPAIVFAEGGGITDFVNTRNGWVVEEMSYESAASTMIDLEIKALKEKGKQAEADYRRKHAYKKNIIKQFESIIDAL
jgi:glycosyltransferase involved in cell wall biosynthesis